jgi:methylated-DNA-[protein]-cysteine S-methyltransferase
MNSLHYGVIPTRFGDAVGLIDGNGALTHFSFDVSAALNHACGLGATPCDSQLRTISQQIAEYCAGRRTRFALALSPAGTPFQREVWRALLAIPFGATVSYGQLAAMLGRPNAARAIGRANATNPIGLIIPCHRVIGANGSLTGYAGGLPRKHNILEFEREHALANLQVSSPQKPDSAVFCGDFSPVPARLGHP